VSGSESPLSRLLKSKKTPACRQGREFTEVIEYFFDKYNADSGLYGQTLTFAVKLLYNQINPNYD